MPRTWHAGPIPTSRSGESAKGARGDELIANLESLISIHIQVYNYMLYIIK